MTGAAPEELLAMANAAAQLPFGSAERETAYQEISAYLVENPIHTPIIQSRLAGRLPQKPSGGLHVP